MANLNLPQTGDPKALLEHARGLFQYHAGQRHDSIRNFFIAFGIFAATDVSAHSSTASGILYLRLIIDLTLLILTIVFWALDFRNAQMVEIDEKALKELEGEISVTYGLNDFRLSERWEKRGQIRRYGNMMKLTFGYFCLLFVLILIWDLYQMIVTNLECAVPKGP